MTQLLEKAFAEAAALSEEEQNAFAEFALNELRSEKKWTQTFENSQEVLAQLGQEALAKHRAGKTKRLDVNEL